MGHFTVFKQFSSSDQRTSTKLSLLLRQSNDFSPIRHSIIKPISLQEKQTPVVLGFLSLAKAASMTTHRKRRRTQILIINLASPPSFTRILANHQGGGSALYPPGSSHLPPMPQTLSALLSFSEDRFLVCTLDCVAGQTSLPVQVDDFDDRPTARPQIRTRPSSWIPFS